MKKCTVIEQNGFLKIDAEGDILAPSSYMTYVPKEENYASFAKAGYRLFSYPVYVTDRGINSQTGIRAFMPSISVGEDQYDFSCPDAILDQILKNNPGTYAFPRVYLVTPTFWDKENPQELSRDYAGETVEISYASEKGREVLWQALRAYVDHVEASPYADRIIGYQLAGGETEEWPMLLNHPEQFVDYSENNRRRYIGWLRDRYETVAKLNEAHGTACGSFEEVAFPVPAKLAYSRNGALRDHDREREAMDYWRYYNESNAETILWFAEKLKAYTGRKALVGAFYGYLWAFHFVSRGLNAFRKILESPDIDFLAATNGPESFPFLSLAGSAALHHKLYFMEADKRTHKTTELIETLSASNPESHAYEGGVWGAAASEFEGLSVMKREMGQMLTHNVGGWWFDMWSGWFRDPKLMHLAEVFRREMEQRKADRLRAQIAVILDETAVYHTALESPVRGYSGDRSHLYSNGICTQQSVQLGRIGAPYDLFEIGDLLRPDFPLEQYKLYIFVNAIHPEEKIVSGIRETLQGGGRTLLWISFSDAYRDGALTDFRLTYAPESEPKRAVYRGSAFPETALPCQRFDAEEGKNAYPVAYFEGTTEPAVLCKPGKDYVSYVSLLPGVPSDLLREIANLAGVHVYTREDAVVYAGSRYVGLYALRDGVYQLRLPEDFTEVHELESGESPAVSGRFIFAPMQKGETKLYKITF